MRNIKLIPLILFLTNFAFEQNNSSLDSLSLKINFLNSDSIDFKNNSFNILDSISEIIKRDSLIYEIESHSCMRTNALIKTQKRAELIKRGIDKSRLKSYGYGITKRKYICTTRVCDMQNERVLIKKIE